MSPADQVNAYLYSEEAVLFNHEFLHSASAEQQAEFLEDMLSENLASVAMLLYKLRYLDGLVRSGKGECVCVCVYMCVCLYVWILYICI
jgi:hypothetical protein